MDFTENIWHSEITKILRLYYLHKSVNSQWHWRMSMQTLGSCLRIAGPPTRNRPTLASPHFFFQRFNYAVEMFEERFIRRTFFAIFAIILFSGNGACDDDGVSDWTCGRSPTLYGYRSPGEKVQKTDSFAKKYTIDYNEHEAVFSLKEKENGRSGFRDFFDENGTKPETKETGKFVVNKCCPWNSRFDVINYYCVESSKGSVNVIPSVFSYGNNNQTSSKYLFVESVPNCGNESVLSVRNVSKVLVDETGVHVDGEHFTRYCVEQSLNNPNQTILLTCHDPRVFCKRKACFRKCCPLKQSYSQFGKKCQNTNLPFKPEFVKFPSLSVDNLTKLSDFGIYMGDACEKQGKYLLEPNEDELSYLDTTGTLYVPLYKKCFAKDEFCIEHVQLDDYSGIGTFLCFAKPSGHFENSRLQYILLSLGLIISSTFLLLTFLVYLFSPSSHNLYGKTLMCYIACLFTAYLSLAVVGLMSTELTKTICTYMGYVILFSFLAAFFWLNVISFDIWKTFRTVQSLERTKSKKGKNLRFIWYSVYAWAFPSVITAACSVVNKAQDFPFESIKPNIGEENCWFSKQTYGVYVFFIAPISLLIVSNILFYIQTAWRIWKVRTDIAKMGKQKRKKFTANKDQFLINGKLFIVMGITWSLEIISFFAPHPIWYISDAANALHGVFIFAVFVLKKKVYQRVFQRIRHPLKSVKHLSSPNPNLNCSAATKSGSSDKNKSQTEATGLPGNSATDSSSPSTTT